MYFFLLFILTIKKYTRSKYSTDFRIFRIVSSILQSLIVPGPFRWRAMNSWFPIKAKGNRRIYLGKLEENNQ